MNLSFSSSLCLAAAAAVVTFVFAILGAYSSGRKGSGGISLIWVVAQILVAGLTIGAILPILSSGNGLQGWAGYYAGAYAIMGMAQLLCLYVIRNFIAAFPREIFDTATVDGASGFQQLVNIVIPRLGPIGGVIGTFFFLAFWNDSFLVSEVLQKENPGMVAAGSPFYICFLLSVPALVVMVLYSLRNSLREMAWGAVKE